MEKPSVSYAIERGMNNGSLTTRRWIVTGRVQGVGFRFFVQHKAVALGLTGWAKNLEDVCVVVVAYGLPERLDDLGAALYLGPKGADVRGVEKVDTETDGVNRAPAPGFSIR
jgi:acylphosphatase